MDIFQQMMQRALLLQQQMEDFQKSLTETVVEGTSGPVWVQAKGSGELLKVTLEPPALQGDPEELSGHILAAVNEALVKGKALTQERVEGLLPGLMNTAKDLLAHPPKVGSEDLPS